MKKLILLVCIALTSCQEDGNLEYIGQEIVDGKVSAIEEGKRTVHHGFVYLPKIWVQNATTTKEISIPFEYEGKWKVGDSCLLIIKKYKQKSENK